jgi:hypothetical protein
MDDIVREKFEEIDDAFKVESDRVSQLMSRVQWLEDVVDTVAEATALQTQILQVSRGGESVLSFSTTRSKTSDLLKLTRCRNLLTPTQSPQACQRHCFFSARSRYGCLFAL